MKENNDDYSCCPFKSSPGRFVGEWTSCIHGLKGRRHEILRELQSIEDLIFLWEINHPKGNK
jgi:hypothetical protein